MRREKAIVLPTLVDIGFDVDGYRASIVGPGLRIAGITQLIERSCN